MIPEAYIEMEFKSGSNVYLLKCRIDPMLFYSISLNALGFFQFNDLLTSKDSKCDWPNLHWHIFCFWIPKMKMYNIKIPIRIYFDMKKKSKMEEFL